MGRNADRLANAKLFICQSSSCAKAEEARVELLEQMLVQEMKHSSIVFTIPNSNDKYFNVFHSVHATFKLGRLAERVELVAERVTSTEMDEEVCRDGHLFNCR